MSEKNEVSTYVISDIHAPFQDDKAIDLFIQVVRERQPDRIIILGDAVDFYALSRFDKDPKRKKDIKYDRDEWHKIAKRIQQAAPYATKYFVEGNHEDRLRKYLWTSASALHDLISLDAIMRFNDFGIKNMGKEFFLDGILFTHGDRISPHASYTAKREHDRRGCSGMSGHTHRLGWYPVRRTNPRTLEDGIEAWHETGCLCSLYPEYTRYPNWHLGWVSLTTLPGRESYDPNFVKILPGYKCFVGEKIYELPGKKHKTWQKPEAKIAKANKESFDVAKVIEEYLGKRDKKKKGKNNDRKV